MDNHQKFYFYSAGGWLIFGLFSAWLLGSQLRFYLINGFVALALIGLIGALVIAKAQCLVIDCGKFHFWYLSTLMGLVIAAGGAAIAGLFAYFPFFSFQTGSPLADWLIWLAYLLFLSASGGVVGGLLAGIFARLAFKKGSTLGWIGISIVNWAASAGLVGLLAVFLRHPDFIGLPILHAVPLAIKAVPIFVIASLVQASILGPRLKSLDLISP